MDPDFTPHLYVKGGLAVPAAESVMQGPGKLWQELVKA
jgi:hypothetical protein